MFLAYKVKYLCQTTNSIFIGGGFWPFSSKLEQFREYFYWSSIGSSPRGYAWIFVLSIHAFCGRHLAYLQGNSSPHIFWYLNSQALIIFNDMLAKVCQSLDARCYSTWAHINIARVQWPWGFEEKGWCVRSYLYIHFKQKASLAQALATIGFDWVAISSHVNSWRRTLPSSWQMRGILPA